VARQGFKLEVFGGGWVSMKQVDLGESMSHPVGGKGWSREEAERKGLGGWVKGFCYTYGNRHRGEALENRADREFGW